ncbi:MAG: M55 family metallopeptidase [Treponema sp.]|jgi:D-amino peptidase|nr:M55 family metallopeptidase [Treponema sp.]
MKVFISADIEGITTTTVWDETNPAHASYQLHAKQMTEEVLACIQGAKNAGAKEIVVKDAHGPAVNIDPARMPSGVILQRNWSGHPYMMAEGIDKTFQAAMFVGYHSSAGRSGNPLSHTISGKHVYMKINGVFASEFLLYSYACALEGVPAVFLSGDKMLCDDFKNLHPKLITCPVKDGIGGMTKNYSVEDTLKNIKELSEKALKQELKDALIRLPDQFELEVYYKEHQQAEKVSWFPGVSRKSDNIVIFRSDSFFEVLRTLIWIT